MKEDSHNLRCSSGHGDVLQPKAAVIGVCSHPEAIEEHPGDEKIAGITGFILAGGASSRMGRNKALLEVDGVPIITRTYRTLASLFHEVIIVTNSPHDYDFLPCRKVPDIFPGYGSIAGLHSALCHSNTPYSFITACDLPFLDPVIIRQLCDHRDGGHDIVVPVSEGGQEPLHALYSSACKEVFEQAIQQGERKIIDIMKRMNIMQVSYRKSEDSTGERSPFLNVNTPEEYEGIK